MKPYLSLFRIRFIHGLQYRAAAIAGLSTQFAWGFMNILAFSAFYRASPGAFPMEFPHLVSYIWIQQALLALFAPWGMDRKAVETIVTGGIAYDLVRPMDLYSRWLTEAIADRVSRAALRCMPILLVAFLLPEPFRMTLPPDLLQLALFALSAVLSMGVVSVFMQLDTISTFYTMSRYNAVFVFLAEFLAGGILPIPFFPEPLRRAAELLPFGSMQNVPLRIYSGSLGGVEAIKSIALQLFWLTAMLLLGRLLMRHALKRVTAQGG